MIMRQTKTNYVESQSGPILPPISVVVIGLNVESFISSCLQAIYRSHYPTNLIEVIYVDGGSTDITLDIVRSFRTVKLIQLNTSTPNAAKGRNAGFHAANHDLVQFVDADSYLNPHWLITAVKQIGGSVGAVAGTLHERFPNRNLFHRMANLEWNIRKGSDGWSIKDIETPTFGGNVLIRRGVLEQTGGYQADLAAGEDPDLSYRIRRMGYKIYRLNSPMASHDINIKSLGPFLRRTRRSGFVYGHLALSYWREPERYMVKRTIAILMGTAAPLIVVLISALSGLLGPGLALALLIMFRLVFQAGHFARVMQISRSEALVYSLYLAFCIFPQVLGVVDSIKKFGLSNIFQKPILETDRDIQFNEVVRI